MIYVFREYVPDFYTEATDFLWPYLTASMPFLMPVALGTVTACVVCFVYSYLSKRFAPQERERRRAMSSLRREMFNKSQMAMELCILVENLYFNRRITLKERNDWYIKFANNLGLKNLIPNSPAYNYRKLQDHFEELKEDLKQKHEPREIYNLMSIRKV